MSGSFILGIAAIAFSLIAIACALVGDAKGLNDTLNSETDSGAVEGLFNHYHAGIE